MKLDKLRVSQFFVNSKFSKVKNKTNAVTGTAKTNRGTMYRECDRKDRVLGGCRHKSRGCE